MLKFATDEPSEITPVIDPAPPFVILKLPATCILPALKVPIELMTTLFSAVKPLLKLRAEELALLD